MRQHPSLQEFAARAIRNGSKSFAFASLLFGRKTKAASHLLYAWCRYADDEIDLATNQSVALANLQRLRSEIVAAYTEPLEIANLPIEVQGIAYLQREYQLPQQLFFDLLEGFQMDLQRPIIKDQAELDRYCYCVAGAVGVLMNQIMSTDPEPAQEYAKALGLAMQKTNILRDFAEDARRGRCYIPETVLAEKGLSAEAFLQLPEAQQLSIFLEYAPTLFAQAEDHYLVARLGYASLPWRSRLAVRMAAAIYREIGIVVLQLGIQSWQRRIYTSLTAKIRLALRELATQLTETKRIA